MGSTVINKKMGIFRTDISGFNPRGGYFNSPNLKAIGISIDMQMVLKDFLGYELDAKTFDVSNFETPYRNHLVGKLIRKDENDDSPMKDRLIHYHKFDDIPFICPFFIMRVDVELGTLSFTKLE